MRSTKGMSQSRHSMANIASPLLRKVKFVKHGMRSSTSLIARSRSEQVDTYHALVMLSSSFVLSGYSIAHIPEKVNRYECKVYMKRWYVCFLYMAIIKGLAPASPWCKNWDNVRFHYCNCSSNIHCKNYWKSWRNDGSPFQKQNRDAYCKGRRWRESPVRTTGARQSC